MGLVPGLPKIPFFLVGGMLVLLGRAVKKQQTAAAAEPPVQELEAVPVDPVTGALAVDPLELAIGFGLVPMVDQRSGGGLLARVGLVRKQIASELGIVIAPVRIHDDVALDSHEYVLRVRGAEVARGRLIPGHRLAMNPGDAVDGLPGTHLTETIRRHADELLTRQETKRLLDGLREQNSAAVDEVVPDKLGVGEIQRALQHLLREGVSIRDLGTIVEAIGDRALLTRDPAQLAESARQALGRTITAAFVDEDKTLRAISLDPTLEYEVAESLAQTPEGEVLALDPARARALLHSLAEQVDRLAATGRRPVVICSSRVRRHIRRLVEQTFPQLAVVSHNEIVPGVKVESAGLVSA